MSVRASHAGFDPVLASLFLISHSTSGVFFQGWVNTIVEMVNNELGTDVEPVNAENPTSESVCVHATCADMAKIRNDAG